MKRTLLLTLCRLGTAIVLVTTSLAGHAQPMVAIVIDDMGYRFQDGREALLLPGELTYSFLPHTPHLDKLLAEAHRRGKEVLVHVPMEAETSNRLLGPGALRVGMTRDEMVATFLASVAAVPGAVGVNNHMGSRLTRRDTEMTWLMSAVRDENLFFVDSRTTAGSVAAKVASREGVPNVSRSVFIDNHPDAEYIEGQLEELLQRAQKKGQALGIAHPHPYTVSTLRAWLPRLREAGVKLVPASHLLESRQRMACSEPAATPAQNCG